MRKTVLVAGASGVVGYGAVKHFLASGDCDVFATARRSPHDLNGATFIPADLTDTAQCARLLGTLSGLTHVVYAALYERPQLITGWQETAQIETNGRMLRNLLDPILQSSPHLRHVTLLQGTKAYGIHVREMKVPAREDRSEVREQPNFYWLQEDYLRHKQKGADWGWTVLRPQIIFGESFGSAMNLIPAIGVYAALARQQGDDLPFPGGPTNLLEAVDADLLGRAIAWSGEAETARNQVFNVNNGDVFLWDNVWPAIAEAYGMRPGPRVPLSLAETLPGRAAEWDRIRERHGLLSPAMDAFVGASFQYADYCFGHGLTEPSPHSLVSTIKIRQAGFSDCMDTEVMFRKWIRLFQDQALLPAASPQ
jgi:nucleoside-diphosphate-sugar epimerase